MKPDEKAFETYIAEWLVEHGGYESWKVGTKSTDFDAERGLDTGKPMTVLAVDRDPLALTLTIVSEFDAPAARLLQVWADPR